MDAELIAFLRALIDHLGAGSLHTLIDDLENKDKGKTEVKTDAKK